MSGFNQFAELLNSTVSNVLGEIVCYRRDSTTIKVKTIIGKTSRPVNADWGAVLEMTDRDYIISASDLNCSFSRPKIGDEIIHNINGKQVIYEVQPEFGGAEVYSLSDNDGINYRIHARKIST